MTTVVEILAFLYDAKQNVVERGAGREDPFARGLAIGMADGLDVAINAMGTLPLMAGRRP